MAKFLIAAALAFLAAPAIADAPEQLPDADPAIWVVNDQDTVIYLFGTFHALDGRSAWFNDEIMTAFAASDELVLETVLPRPPVTAEASQPLNPQVPPHVRRMTVAPSASFLASTRMAISAGRSRGMTFDKGADEVLRRAAEESGKSVQGLESVQYQLDMFARLPNTRGGGSSDPDKQQMMLGMSAIMARMQAAWNEGDQGVFTNVVEHVRKGSPATYQLMFTDRNANWANWIANRLERPGTVFVAVGAGHLAGIDSVQAKLLELGVRSERIN